MSDSINGTGITDKVIKDIQARKGIVAGYLIEVDGKLQLILYKNGVVDSMTKKVQHLTLYENVDGGIERLGGWSMPDNADTNDEDEDEDEDDEYEPEIVEKVNILDSPESAKWST